MKVAYNRRSKDDIEWKKVKDFVYKRDKNSCQFLKCLSMKEYYQLKRESELKIDPAHIFSAASEPSQIYNPKNVICLTRFIHRRMDNYQNPLTGETIDLNTHYYWWWRIYNHSLEEYNNNIDYKKILFDAITK